MSNLIQGFGRNIPEGMADKIAATWGARAIYTKQIIDLLPDRQSWYVAGFSEDDADQTSTCYNERREAMQPLMTWVNQKGLPFLRSKEVTRKLHDQTAVVEFGDGRFYIEASPQSSYGYLYIRAWQLLPETEQ